MAASNATIVVMVSVLMVVYPTTVIKGCKCGGASLLLEHSEIAVIGEAQMLIEHYAI